MPAHNDRATLPAAAQAALATGYDLLVIDDGSTDNCLRAIADLPCRTMRSAEHQGKGATVLQGAGQAAQLGYDTLITIDGDGRCNPADLHLLVAAAESCTTPCLIIGSQQRPWNAVSGPNHFHRSFANSCVRLECGVEVPDTRSSFCLYPVKELLALKLTRSHSGFAIESLVKLAWSGIPVHAVPVTVRHPSGHRPVNRLRKITDTLGLALLHGQLVIRRLLPWPHQKLTDRAPLQKQVYESISQNPLKVLGKICKEHTSPLWLATAVWLGIFMGALPLLAIHTVAIIYVAHRLHLNKVAAVAASQFCMPPVVPVLCIQMGYYLRNGELLVDFSWQRWLLGVHERLWEWFIGSLLVGPLLGLLGAVVMYWMAARLQHHKKIKPPTGI
jgi:uncharacterized protein (DUF2062 family)